MKILFYSQFSYLGFAQKLKNEDNEILIASNMPEFILKQQDKPDLIITDIIGIDVDNLKKSGFSVIGVPKQVFDLVNNEKIVSELLKKSNITKYNGKEIPHRQLLIEMWFSNGKLLYPANQTVVVIKQVEKQMLAKFVLNNYKTKQPFYVQLLFKRFLLLFEKLAYTGAFTIAITSEDKGMKKDIKWLQVYAGINYGYNYSHILKYCELLKCSATDFLMKYIIGGQDIPVDIDNFIYTVKSFIDFSVKSGKIEDAENLIKEDIKQIGGLI